MRNINLDEVEDPDVELEQESDEESKWLAINVEGIKNPCLLVYINNTKRLALVDTGASVSLINENLVEAQLNCVELFKNKVLDATGNRIPVIGQLGMQIIVQREE